MTAATVTRCYHDNYELLCAQLDWLDRRIRARSSTLASAAFAHSDEVIGDVDDDAPSWAPHDAELSLPQLARMFSLTPMECQALIVCLAPDLRAHYKNLYAQLHDDATRRAASIGLVLELLCDLEADRWAATQMLCDASPLVRWQLLKRLPDHAGGTDAGLDQPLRIDPRITQFLLGDSTCDPRLHTVARLIAAEVEPPILDADVESVANLLHDWAFADPGHELGAAPVVYLRGPAGIDATEMARYLCGAAGLPVLAADTAALLAAGLDQTTMLTRVLCREAVLSDCAVFLDGADALLADPARPTFNALRAAIADAGRPLILAGEEFWRAPGAFGESVFVALTVGHPDISARRMLWRGVLSGCNPDESWSDTLASRFVLTARQIRNAAALARRTPRRGDDDRDRGVDLDDLVAACRAESDQDLGELAVKVDPRRGWADLVLPVDNTAQLQELCDQIRHRHVVYGQWGYGDRLGRGGVTALFCGQPGTGKTVAAQVIAGEVGLSLYKVDLSGVVSKYIGETEKNLAKIFAKARAGNAVLFFDEADALFGKRTEVSDAHDRYANIETSYLLQKLEEHDGVVILASNLRANLDDAFTRRIRCVVEFPFPDESLRRRIWESHFPFQAPLSADVDLDYLAHEFPVAGGNISNIALGAAFLAAADGGTITSRHVLAATKREYDKLGKLWR
ncbi:MAG: ATP-binding protein [Candidatus Sericytochromatia bacterium]